MAVAGSKGVGWKVSSLTKSLCCGDCVGAGVDLRPVMLSQLVLRQYNWWCMCGGVPCAYIVILKMSNYNGVDKR